MGEEIHVSDKIGNIQTSDSLRLSWALETWAET